VPGYGKRYWEERTPAVRRPSYPTFRGAHTVDAVVIGGGLTGLTAAYVLAKGGLDVVLLEAGRLAAGATAGGLGTILPEPDALFREVDQADGLKIARTAWQEARRSGLDTMAAFRRAAVKCDLTPATLVLNARTPESAHQLKREHAARHEAGLDAAWLPAKAGRAEIASASEGAVRLHDAATYDPVRAALGLARAADAAGARIFEHSAVTRTRFTRKYADVIADGGSLRTRAVVVATGGPGRLFGQLRRHVREVDGFALVTAPLSAPMARAAGPIDRIVGERGELSRWLRWLPDRRALFAGTTSKPIPARQRDKALVAWTGQLMYELSVRYPPLSGLRAQWSWHAPVVTTADGLPWIGVHRNYPFHFFAIGLGWHGDGLAWHAARAALRHFSGGGGDGREAFGFLRHL
jgi:glycine/D-amino acid oxidase-like deaminating enzyme